MKGDTYVILEAALDALFADPEQQKHGCIPPALDWSWDRLVGPYLQEAEAAEQSHQEAKRRAEEQHAREVEERARQRNGSKDGRGGAPVAVAELMRSIGREKL